jgi:hypothetical protein
MGFPGYRRSIRASLAYVGMAAATASALVVLQSGVAFADDAITVVPGSGTPITTVQEGNFTALQVVGKFKDTGRPGGGACNTQGYVATINWGDGSKGTGTVSCESSGEVASDTFDVTGSHNYADSGSYDITVSVVDTSEDGESSGAAVKTDTATVKDASIFCCWSDNSSGGSYVGAEGSSVTVAVTFIDDRSFPEGMTSDTAITGTIDWGDGSALQTVSSTHSSSSCECATFDINASHVYDSSASAIYHITVFAKDDGGSNATATYTAVISDAALTAGGDMTLGATATQTFNSVVGTFTDDAGAQAAAADFVASINWGDSTTSTGTVTKTATGAFGVSGTHAYATTGSKSITATVTDEEGSTVTLHATATVAAAPAPTAAPVAPAVLPATGQPTQPAAPFIPLALLVILGLVSLVAGGRILAKMPR